MDNREKIDLFFQYFVHENSAFAEQVYREDKGTAYFPKRQGECNHYPKHKPLRNCPSVREIIYEEKHLMDHLHGRATYAPYQISKNDTVKWICFDIDAYEAAEDKDIHDTLFSLARVLYTHLGGNSFAVEGSGSKGYHLWVFFEEPLETKYAFAFGNALAAQVKSSNGINIEVYPKQMTNKVYGNTVKPPFGIHQKTKNRCLLLNNKLEPHEDQFGTLKGIKRIPVATVKKLAGELYTIPLDKEVVIGYNEGNESGGWYPYCLKEILIQGCKEGIRDEAAFRLAGYFKDRGIPRHYADMMLHDWNDRNSPQLEEEVLDTKIDSAYSNSYTWKPCMNRGFDEYCSSECPFFKNKCSKRQVPEATAIGTIADIDRR